MASTTKVGFWAGAGTPESPYKPDFASRYELTSYDVLDSAREPEGVCYALLEGTTEAIDAINADDGVAPSSALLPTQAPDTLTMPDDPVDLLAAVAAMSPGDTLELPQGIYHLDDIGTSHKLGPQGSAIESVIQAAAGARVVITSSAGGTPNLFAPNYITWRNLWIGGEYGITEYGCAMGGHVTIDGCLFTGHYQSISDGAGTYNTYKNSWFIRTGKNPLDHAIYIAAGETPDKYSSIDHNVFLDSYGFPLHMWHEPAYVTGEWNFIHSNLSGISSDGPNCQYTGNILWQIGASDITSPTGAAVFNHTLFGYDATSTITLDGVIQNSRFIRIPRGAGTTLHFGDIPTLCGYSYTQINDAINKIMAILDGGIASFWTDGTLDYYLAVLHAVTTNYEAYIS